MANKIIKYRNDLKERAQELRRNLTPAEKILWQSIRKKSLGVEFHRQVPILDYIADFYCHEIGLVLEIDGATHEKSFLEDSKRQERLEKEGLRFLRFKNDSIFNNLSQVISEIEKRLKNFQNNDTNISPKSPLQRGDFFFYKKKFQTSPNRITASL